MLKKGNIKNNTEQYDLFGETFGKSREKMYWNEIDVVLDDFSQSEISVGKILDVGCGNGRLLQHFHDHAKSGFFKNNIQGYIGVDTSKMLLYQAEEVANTNRFFAEQVFIYGDMRELDTLIQGQRFDAIFFVASFHHLRTFEERISVIQDGGKMLSKNGKIYMINWNLLHPNQKKYVSSKKMSYENESADFEIKIAKYMRFYHSFSEKEYRELAKKCSFKLTTNFGERNSVVIFEK